MPDDFHFHLEKNILTTYHWLWTLEPHVILLFAGQMPQICTSAQGAPMLRLTICLPLYSIPAVPIAPFCFRQECVVSENIHVLPPWIVFV